MKPDEAPFRWREFARLLPFLGPYRWALLSVALLVCAAVGVGLAYPLFARYVLDQVLAARRSDLLLPAAAGLVGFALAGLVTGGGCRVVYAVATARMLTDMRQALFRHVLGMPASTLSRARAGDLAARLHHDLTEAQRAVTDGLLQLVTTALGVVASLGLMLWLDVRLTLATVALAPLVLGSAALFRRSVERRSRRLRDASAEMLAFLVESLGRMKLIQAYALESRESDRYRGRVVGFMDELLRFQLVGAGATGGPAVVLGLVGLVVFLFGGRAVIEGKMTLGTLLAFGVYQVRFFSPLQDLVRGALRLARAGASVRRILEVLDVPSSALAEASEEAPAGPPPALAWESVEFSYGPGREALRGVSLEVPAGGVVALVGPNGAGKSTLVDLLLGFEQPSAGRVLLGGRDVRDTPAHEVRRSITLVPREAYLLNATVEENLRFARPDATRPEMEEAARAAGAMEWIESLPEGWATPVGERGVAVSDGQRQRLALARGLLRRTPVMVLDEATSSVDLLGEERVWEALRAGPQPPTCLVLTHRLASARRADLVVVLEDGRVVQQGLSEDLQEQPGLYADLAALA